MRKLRSDATWNKLTREQQINIEFWLFSRNLGYQDVVQNVKDVFEITLSYSTVQRIYKLLSQQRLRDSLLDGTEEAFIVDGAPAQKRVYDSAAMKILSLKFFQRIKNDGMDDLPKIGRLLLDYEGSERQRERNELIREGQQIQRDKLKLAREKWVLDVEQKVLDMLPEQMKLEQERQNAEDPFYENKQLNKIRIGLWGKEVADVNRLPENDDEEKNRERYERERLIKANQEGMERWKHVLQRSAPEKSENAGTVDEPMEEAAGNGAEMPPHPTDVHDDHPEEAAPLPNDGTTDEREKVGGEVSHENPIEPSPPRSDDASNDPEIGPNPA